MERILRAPALALSGLVAGAVLGLAPGLAAAQEFEIKSPLVEEGTLEFEWQGGVQSRFPKEDEAEDDEAAVRQAHELSVGYGVTSFWQPELALTLAQEKGDHLKVDAVGIENTFQLLPTDAYFANLGLLLTYEASVRHEIHSLELGPLVQVWVGPFSNTANAIFEQQFGDDRESASTAFEYAWQTLYKAGHGLKVGFEAFGEIESFADDAPDLDEQEHRIGPVGYFETNLGPFELSIGGGFLFGLTDETPDHAIKFDIELEWGG